MRYCHGRCCGMAGVAAFCWCWGFPGLGLAQTAKVEANRMIELTLASNKAYADPFNAVQLDVRFTEPDANQLLVPAFWAGGQQWRVRYASGKVGLHTYRTVCSDGTNDQLHGLEGTIEVLPYTGDNALYRHGPLRVAADRRHFEHVDGTPFLWLADTWWMGLCQRLKWPEEFQALAADRREKGFNVIQIVAGLYPDMPAFDERGASEAGFPWEKDYSRVRPEYFDAADRRLAHLVESGFTPCIVGAWGYHLPWLGVEKMKQHWRYLVARYGAWPVVWCVAGEATMPYYLSPKKDEETAFQKRVWTEVAAYIRKTDPFHRLVTVHPGNNSRSAVEDVSVLDFDMLQTGHGDRSSIPRTIRAVRASQAAEPPLPTVNGEVCYEGILNTCFEDVQRFMVWACLLSGTAGHTYGANGIWQVNRKEQAYGASPHGGNWGTTPWDEAMKLPGSRQVGLAKRLLERYPWYRFEPHPEWASFGAEPCRFAGAEWIWFPEGNPATDAPAEKRFFRRTFEMAAGKVPDRAVLCLSVDDRFTAYLNGQRVGSGEDWRTGRQLAAIERWLKPGKNLLAVAAENRKGALPQNPAGLICQLDIQFTDGTIMTVISDKAWHCSQKEASGWQEPGFIDTAWPEAMSIGRYGQGPWGQIASRDPFQVPYAAGVPSGVRIVYVPSGEPVVLHKLEPQARYTAACFDPVTGQQKDLGIVRPQADGSWTSPTPPTGNHDWVLILDATKPAEATQPARQ